MKTTKVTLKMKIFGSIPWEEINLKDSDRIRIETSMEDLTVEEEYDDRYLTIKITNDFSELIMSSYFSHAEELIGYINGDNRDVKIRVIAILDQEKEEWTITLTKVKRPNSSK